MSEISISHLTKKFEVKGHTVTALNDVSLSVEKGQIYGIIGMSGAGKSTLVRSVNYLEKPTEGSVFIEGTDLASLSENELRAKRSEIGMIFQSFNLLEQKNVIDNVCFPLELKGIKRKAARDKARGLLETVGLSEKEKAYPSQLSGGQKQRVAIARALAAQPEVLLCDEATSALDPITTSGVLDLLQRINREYGVTIVVITHEMKVVEQICNRVAIMNRGRVEEIGAVKDIFLNPKSDTSRRLVLSHDTKSKLTSNKRCIRIVFDGISSSEPVLADLVLETGVRLNILGANTEDIGGSAFGQMLIEWPDEKTVRIIKDYLYRKKISFEEFVLKKQEEADE